MDVTLPASARSVAAATPIAQPDLRPTADTAALIRNPRPQIDLPIPHTNALQGAVAEMRMSDKPSSIAVPAVAPAERTLKPYGVKMLPDAPASADRSEPKDNSASEEEVAT